MNTDDAEHSTSNSHPHTQVHSQEDACVQLHTALNFYLCQTHYVRYIQRVYNVHLCLASTLLKNDNSSASVSCCKIFSGLIKANRRQDIRCGIFEGRRGITPGYALLEECTGGALKRSFQRVVV